MGHFYYSPEPRREDYGTDEDYRCDYDRWEREEDSKADDYVERHFEKSII